MNDDSEVFRLCGEIAELRRRMMAVLNEPDVDGYGPMTCVRPLSREQDQLVERLADLSCSTDEARRARAFVLYERTILPGSATQRLAHAVACDALEPR